MGTKKTQERKSASLFLPISDSNITRAMVPSFDEQKALRSGQTHGLFLLRLP
jgi:hypothetical protein